MHYMYMHILAMYMKTCGVVLGELMFSTYIRSRISNNQLQNVSAQ